jgi:hypothetical protein
MTDDSLRTAVRNVLYSLENPAPAKVSYDKESKGQYGLDKADGEHCLYIRDCLRVHKAVRVEGEYKVKCSSPEVAIKDAVRRKLGVGRYRQFIMDGRWESLTLGGQAILIDGIEDNLYLALPEASKAILG